MHSIKFASFLQEFFMSLITSLQKDDLWIKLVISLVLIFIATILNRCSSKHREKKKISVKMIISLLLVLSIIFIGLVELVFLFIIWFNFSKEMNSTEVVGVLLQDAIESSFVGTGIAVISAAISVWAGLNIISALEKTELENAKEEIKKLVDEVNSLTQKVENVNEKWRLSAKNLFLQELEKDEICVLSQYFYEEFSKWVLSIETLYNDLAVIDQNARTAYVLHTSDSANSNSKFEDAVRVVITTINALKYREIMEDLEEEERRLVDNYLDFQMAETYFLTGYYKSGDMQYCDFKNAATLFSNLLERMSEVKAGTIIENIDEKVSIINGKIGTEQTLFFFNSIGEAYSKILFCASEILNRKIDGEVITDKVISECANRAVIFLEAATNLSEHEKVEIGELKWRNLGCAYERVENFSKRHADFEFGLINAQNQIKDEIIKNYTQAFKKVLSDTKTKTKRVQYVYSTTLRYYEKYLKLVFKYEYTSIGKESDRQGKIKNNYKKWNKIMVKFRRGDLKLSNYEEVRNYVKDYETIASIAIADHPRYPEQRGLHGLALTWIILFLLCGDYVIRQIYPESCRYYLNMILEDIRHLDVMEDHKDFAEDLRIRYQVICDYIMIKGE